MSLKIIFGVVFGLGLGIGGYTFLYAGLVVFDQVASLLSKALGSRKSENA
jgi:hypothetical protein